MDRRGWAVFGQQAHQKPMIKETGEKKRGGGGGAGLFAFVENACSRSAILDLGLYSSTFVLYRKYLF